MTYTAKVTANFLVLVAALKMSSARKTQCNGSWQVPQRMEKMYICKATSFFVSSRHIPRFFHPPIDPGLAHHPPPYPPIRAAHNIPIQLRAFPSAQPPISSLL
ncbi:hypothetical protein JB92DRAFT_2928563 [Gautieria morchelliformis]|nr:hypothetical protein JB92DRAFT_2928563 [Gautieria morchelliformis]